MFLKHCIKATWNYDYKEHNMLCRIKMLLDVMKTKKLLLGFEEEEKSKTNFHLLSNYSLPSDVILVLCSRNLLCFVNCLDAR